MLPNWLYGKSKSKLASILGGGGGTPADYDQVKAQVTQNAEDILLLSDALDDKAALTQITNPNILHNPWFQVNQRGETTVSANGLFVDRWRVLCAAAGSTTFTLNSNGTITIDNSLGEAHCYFVQRRTAKTISRIAGRTITASIMLSDGTVRSGTGTYVDTETTNYYEDDDIKMQSIAQSVGQFFVLRVEAGKTITVKALKIELGSVSTLAMDTAPDMATELAKCKRYFQRFAFSTGALIGIGFTQWAQGIRFSMPYTEMRSGSPQLTIISSANKVGYTSAGSAAAVAVSAVSIAYVSKGLITLQATVSDLTPGTVYAMINMDSDTMYIDFSAEL